MSQRIRVLFVSGTLSGGGAERVTSTLLQHLDRTRFEPHLLLLRHHVTYPLPDDVPLDYLHQPQHDKAGRVRTLSAMARRQPWILWQTIRGIQRVIERERPEVVVSNIAEVNVVTGEAIRRCRIRPRWVARFGNLPSREGRLVTLGLRHVLRHSDQVIVNAHAMLDPVREFFHLPPQRCRVLVNPTDFERIDEQASQPPGIALPAVQADELVLLAVGRLAAAKRYDLMLNAVERVAKTHRIRLWICGQGPMRETLQHRVATSAVLQRVVDFLGFVNNPYAVMRRANVLVMTSDYEGLPNALIEAQGLGLPAISTDCQTGPSEIIDDGQTGMLVRVGDQVGFEQAVMMLLDDPKRWRDRGERAMLRARNRYGIRAVLLQWQGMLAEVSAMRQEA